MYLGYDVCAPSLGICKSCCKPSGSWLDQTLIELESFWPCSTWRTSKLLVVSFCRHGTMGRWEDEAKKCTILVNIEFNVGWNVCRILCNLLGYTRYYKSVDVVLKNVILSSCFTGMCFKLARRTAYRHATGYLKTASEWSVGCSWDAIYARHFVSVLVFPQKHDKTAQTRCKCAR